MRVLANDGIAKEGKVVLENAGHEVVTDKIPQEELAAKIADFDAIIVRSATRVTKDIIDASNLKVIGRAGVGLDNIDTGYAVEKGIPVVNTPGASAISVAELTIAHMFAVSRFLHLSKGAMQNGEWPKKAYAKGVELTGKTLGLIGIGSIGKEVARRAIGLGMTVIAYDPFVEDPGLNIKMVSKDDLLATADYISMHMPFIKENGATLTKTEFDKMKDGVIITNCARGGVIKEADLLEALNSGKVARAAIDVFENEPITDAQKELVNHPNVSVTPHIGAATNEAQTRVSSEIAEKVAEHLK